jgi:hypothetical protein
LEGASDCSDVRSILVRIHAMRLSCAHIEGTNALGDDRLEGALVQLLRNLGHRSLIVAADLAHWVANADSLALHEC